MLVIDIVHDFRFTNTNTHLLSEESNLKHFDIIHYSKLNPQFRMQSNQSICLSLINSSYSYIELHIDFEMQNPIILVIFVLLNMITAMKSLGLGIASVAWKCCELMSSETWLILLHKVSTTMIITKLNWHFECNSINVFQNERNKRKDLTK